MVGYKPEAAVIVAALFAVGCNLLFGVDELSEGAQVSAAASVSSAGGGGGGHGGSASSSTSVSSTSTGGRAGVGGAAGAPVADPGCSDGTRELFVDPIEQPDIAGCSGAWSVPGIKSLESLTPACGLAAGNDGKLPDGEGCSAADLCQAGWHPCESAAEVALRSSTGGCPSPSEYPLAGLWLARQGQTANGELCTDRDVNNLLGCGSMTCSAVPDSSCAPLDCLLLHNPCNALASWSCGGNMFVESETLVVVKSGSDQGGVLCCRGVP